MALQSNLFKGDRRLEACLLHDSSHVTPGAIGEHVIKIQAALIFLDGLSIDPREHAAGRYGPSTADAVLSFKQKRNIVNRAYQTQADNIVGKMTIAALDRELLDRQEPIAPRFRGLCLRPFPIQITATESSSVRVAQLKAASRTIKG